MNKRKHQSTEAAPAEMSVDELDVWADGEFAGETIQIGPRTRRRSGAVASPACQQTCQHFVRE